MALTIPPVPCIAFHISVGIRLILRQGPDCLLSFYFLMSALIEGFSVLCGSIFLFLRAGLDIASSVQWTYDMLMISSLIFILIPLIYLKTNLALFLTSFYDLHVKDFFYLSMLLF